MVNTDILYKVIALYILNKSAIPLKNSAICEFFVNKNYTDYFTALSIINNLGESGLIDTKTSNNVTTHTINEKGRSTLEPMLDRLSAETKSEVEEYLSINHVEFKRSKDLYANYDTSGFGGFMVHLVANEDNKPIIDLNFHVGSEVQAKSICTNWRNNYEAVFDFLMENLL